MEYENYLTLLRNASDGIHILDPDGNIIEASDAFCQMLGYSLLPSIRVDEPILSIVATRRKADRRSGASVPKARHAPLNSSILAIIVRMSWVIWMVSVRIMAPIVHPITPNYAVYPKIHPLTPKRRRRIADCHACSIHYFVWTVRLILAKGQ